MAFRSSLRGRAASAWLVVPALAALALSGCRSLSPRVASGPPTGDEIVVAGQRYHTGTRVIGWRDPGGYDGYAGLPPFLPRQSSLSEKEKRRIREHGWNRRALEKVVDQFVLHYDACGVSKVCFETLHARGLSVHFLLDVDGTLYQTVDLQERALHATTSNDRSIGIEMANIGAYPPAVAVPLDLWYRRGPDGSAVLSVPLRIRDPGIATPNFIGRSARPEPVQGVVQDKTLAQYDFTPEQYAALAKLAATLCRVFPRIHSDYPRAADGGVLPHKLPDRDLEAYHGILGHYHIQENKVDPGPAFDWPRFLAGVRGELKK